MKQVQIYIDKEEEFGKIPLPQFILRFLLDNGIAGATCIDCASGFGNHYRLKHPGNSFILDEQPSLITFSDETEKAQEVITELRKYYRGGFITMHDVEQY